jgi:hypothetical protein
MRSLHRTPVHIQKQFKHDLYKTVSFVFGYFSFVKRVLFIFISLIVNVKGLLFKF